MVEDKSKLLIREQYYFDTLKPTYNIRLRAESNFGLSLSTEAKEKLRKFWTGKKKGIRSEQHKINLGNAVRGKTKGIKRSDELKRKYSLSKKGKLNPAYGKPSHRRKLILQIEIDTNEELRIWDSVTLAAHSFNKRHHGISNCLTGRAKTAHGHKWQYL